MIVELILGIFAALAKGLASLFGALAAPEWLLSAGASFAQVVSLGAGLDAWVPWNLLVTVTTAVLGCIAVSFGIKLARIVLSLFTGGGGGAA